MDGESRSIVIYGYLSTFLFITIALFAAFMFVVTCFCLIGPVSLGMSAIISWLLAGVLSLTCYGLVRGGMKIISLKDRGRKIHVILLIPFALIFNAYFYFMQIEMKRGLSSLKSADPREEFYAPQAAEIIFYAVVTFACLFSLAYLSRRKIKGLFN